MSDRILRPARRSLAQPALARSRSATYQFYQHSRPEWRRVSSTPDESTACGMRRYTCDRVGVAYAAANENVSTRTCFLSGCLSSPTGSAGPRTTRWTGRVCGTEHNRDCGTACNFARTECGNPCPPGHRSPTSEAERHLNVGTDPGYCLRYG